MKTFLLGIDIGTSACKAAVFDLEGTVLAQSSRSYPVYYPAPDQVEQNPLEWWDGVCEAVKEIIYSGKIDPAQIAGIGVDGQSWSAIPVDGSGKVLSNTPIWMDTRSAEIAKKVTERIGTERILEISGNSFEPTYSTPKILWFKEMKPDIYKAAHMFLQSNSYIVYRLTGCFTQDISQGYGVHSFNMKKGGWDDGFCDELGISRDKLPQIYPCHQVAGEVTNEAAETTGLRPGYTCCLRRIGRLLRHSWGRRRRGGANPGAGRPGRRYEHLHE